MAGRREPSQTSRDLREFGVWETASVKVAPGPKRTRRPAWLRLIATGAQLPFEVLVRVDVKEGRGVATGLLLLSEGAISAADVRALPVGYLVDQALQMGELFIDALRVQTTTPPPPGRRGHSKDHWPKVAELWREALDQRPKAPVDHIAGKVGRHPSTVRRWLARAREMGLIEREES